MKASAARGRWWQRGARGAPVTRLFNLPSGARAGLALGQSMSARAAGPAAASDEAYRRMAAALEKLTKEADTLAEYQKLMKKHDLTLSQLNKSFDQVQSRLERIAAVKPSKELLNQ